MHRTSQPWIHSWYGDFLGLHGIPFIFSFLAIFKLGIFSGTFNHWGKLIFYVLVVDWAHIFAQWYRIYSNPVESNRNKWVYPISYFLLIPILTLVLFSSPQVYLETFLVYFVIFHFMKQIFGYIKFYSRVDGQKTKVEILVEDILIYSSMIVPVLYWHQIFVYKKFYWNQFLIKSELLIPLFYLGLIVYLISAVAYVTLEYKRSVKNQRINIPKNMALLSGALGWGIVSFLTKTPLLIFFTVILTHDMSYIVFVWLVGRRDEMLSKKKIKWFSWWSSFGFVAYFFVIVFISQIVIAFHHSYSNPQIQNNFIFGKMFYQLPMTPGGLYQFGMAIFFATQAHHYFIDRFLWKKEKDLEFMIKTGKKSLS